MAFRGKIFNTMLRRFLFSTVNSGGERGESLLNRRFTPDTDSWVEEQEGLADTSSHKRGLEEEREEGAGKETVK